jgi:hypothetical protein
MWMQIAGKVKLALTPRVNHWWNVVLYLNSRGLTTLPIPHAAGSFDIRFDFIDHCLVVETSEGATGGLKLSPRTVAEFYDEFMELLRSMGIDVHAWAMPVEVPDPIPFRQDRVHAAYDPAAAARFWRVLLSVHSVLREFRARFIGKCSPVHFFWGSFDLAVTRFSGRLAPARAGADVITREAYSHECSSAGFWPGSPPLTDAAFYSYAAPEPTGFAGAKVRPDQAFYHPELKEFILMYEDVRRSASPRDALLEFLQSTYEAAASLGHWDRTGLEVDRGKSEGGTYAA